MRYFTGKLELVSNILWLIKAWDTFLKDPGHAKCFFHPEVVELKFTNLCVSFYRIRKIAGFLLEDRSNTKITLIITKCIVIYHGNKNGNHGYCV